MFFWIREIVGWALVVAALFLIRLGVSYVADPEAPRIIEASVIMFAAMGLVRMGILLIRVSTAARICLKRNERTQHPQVSR